MKKQYSVQEGKDGKFYVLFRCKEGFGGVPQTQEQFDTAVALLKDKPTWKSYFSWLSHYSGLEPTKFDTVSNKLKQLNFLQPQNETK